MVHYRLNEKQSSPNPHINFISALTGTHHASQDDAHQLLCALAAQVRPVMKANGFSVNSLEEYEHNSVFLGRNWNNGETIELVLRRRDGLFLPTSSLISTLCHELAHIKHMNHGPGFQALWKQLRNDVHNLQRKGYFGDGYWSSGQRLADGAKVAGAGVQTGDLPQYMCGGAHSRSRPAPITRRQIRTDGRTSKKRKAGTRVTRPDAFLGSGVVLNSGEADNQTGTGFGKQARSKRAREQRAFAAEKRLRALQAQSPASTSNPDELSTESDSETEAVPETDRDRLKSLLDSIQDEGLVDLKDEPWDIYDFEFGDGTNQDSAGGKIKTTTSENYDTMRCDLQPSHPSHSTFTSSSLLASAGSGKGKVTERRLSPDFQDGNVGNEKAVGRFGQRNLVQAEINFSRKEPLDASSRRGTGDKKTFKNSANQRTDEDPWSCLVCTFDNPPGYLACSACGTTMGESVWAGRK